MYFGRQKLAETFAAEAALQMIDHVEADPYKLWASLRLAKGIKLEV